MLEGLQRRAGTARGLLQGVGKLCVKGRTGDPPVQPSRRAAARAGQPSRVQLGRRPHGSSRTGLCPHAGGAGTGQRSAPTESVLNKPQSSPTVLLVLLDPFLPLEPAFLTSEASSSTERGRHMRDQKVGHSLGWAGRRRAPEGMRPGLGAHPGLTSK